MAFNFNTSNKPNSSLWSNLQLQQKWIFPRSTQARTKSRLVPFKRWRGSMQSRARGPTRSRPAPVQGFTHLHRLPPHKGSEMCRHLICLQPRLINFFLGTDLSLLGRQPSYLCFLTDFQFPLPLKLSERT